MSEEEQVDSIKERIEKITTINFSITKCPHKVYEEFVSFCKSETNDNYSMGLKILLDAQKMNMKELVIFSEIEHLQAELEDLKQRLDLIKKPEPEKEPEKKVKTFGSDKLI